MLSVYSGTRDIILFHDVRGLCAKQDTAQRDNRVIASIRVSAFS